MSLVDFIEGKIPLSFNKVAPLANHLIGEQRQNTPNLQVMPDKTHLKCIHVD